MVLVSVNCLLPQHGVGGTLWFSTFRQGMASPDSICEPNITNTESDKPESFPKKDITPYASKVKRKETSSEEGSTNISLTGEALGKEPRKEHEPIFSFPSSELFISAHDFNDALSSLSSHVDRRQLIDFCLSLNIISKESHSILLQSESMSFPLDPVFATSSKDLASFNNVMKVWNATEMIIRQLQLATKYLNDVITDALIILLSFHISDPNNLKPLADCLGSESLVPVPHESLPFVLFQILWDWRNKVPHANCRVLVEALLQSEALPFNIAEFIISYTKSEHHRDYSISTLSHKKEHALSVMEVRHCFAQTYINIMEEIDKERVANWLGIASDTNVHDFILKRCSWVNYDLLKELANNFDCNKAFDKYFKLHERCMGDVKVFEIPSEFIPIIPKRGHHFIQVILPQQLSSLFSGMVLYEIKSRLSKKLGVDEKHFLISGLKEENLCVTVAVGEQFLKHDTLGRLSILWDDQQFVHYDTLYIGSSSHMSGNSVDVGSNGCSWSSPAEATDERNSVFVSSSVPSLNSSASNYKDDTNLSAVVEDVDIVADIDVDLDQGPGLKISMTEFKRIILNHKVPVALCLVAAMGLPYCGKTSLLKAVFRDNIKFKEGATLKFEDYFTRKKDSNSLSVYELCVLGGKPQNQYSWSFATERYGAIFSILCGLVRHVALAKSDISKVEFEQPKQQQHQDELARLVEKHFSWLMGKSDKYLKEAIFEDTKKETLLLNGLTLVNVMDVGVNKALYDFLPIMLSLCRNHLRLVAFSLDRDGPKLHEVPDLLYDRYTKRGDHQVIMKESSRLTHLLHFATLGCQQKEKEQEDSSRTIVIAFSNDEPSGTTLSQFEEVKRKIQDEAKKKNVDRFFSNFACVSVSNSSSLKEAKENVTNLIIDDKIYKKDLPLRWIFLRSLVISVRNEEIKIMILKRRDISDIAVHQMGMDEEELEKFLTTFTDFGSILYMPQFKALKDIVIVDIWEFMRYLNKLFYPETNESWYKDLVTYGIIKKKQAKEILKEYEEDFMKIIVTFGMAAYISKGRVFLPGRTLFEECYYLPSARTTKGTSTEHDGNNDYAFLEIESVTFPANVQASVTHEIMKKQNFYLIRSKCYNTTEFEFRPSSSRSIRITMTDGGSKTKLAFHIRNTFNDMYWCVQACKGVIEACCDSFNRKTNQIRDLKFRIGVPCSATEGDNHYLYFGDISDVKNCRACSADDSFSCRKCWIEAAKACEKLRKTEEFYDLTFAELSQVVQKVSRNGMIPQLMNELRVDIHKSTRSYKDDRQAMEALMKWEAKQQSPKPSLATILRRMGLTSVADSLQPPTT